MKKFPIPNKLTLFSHIAKSIHFSKFNRKTGLWKLGKHLKYWAKIIFCIPNHIYEWKIISFGLKPSPSIFQKAMIKIFLPFLYTSLVHIDDILLFSNTLDEHLDLLCWFHGLVKKYNVMLSATKMILIKNKIIFMGIPFVHGEYSLGPHIFQELLKFLDTNFSIK